MQVGKTLFFRAKVSGISTGAAPTLTLPPISPASNDQTFPAYINNAGSIGGGAVALSGTTMNIYNAGGGAFSAAAITVIVSGHYEAA